MKIARAAALIACLVAAIPLFGTIAQAVQPAPQNNQALTYSAFSPIARTADLSATTSSGSTLVTISTKGPTARVCNTGAVFAYFAFSTTSSLTVTPADGFPIAPASCVTLNATGAIRAAAITASSTATVQVVIGAGSP